MLSEYSGFRVTEGFSPDQRSIAAQLFWRAFHEKLLPVMKPEAQALDFIERVMQPSHAVGAVASDGTLIGVAGFKTKHGAFIGGGLEDLQSVYGWFGGAWRGLLLSVLERPLQDDTLTMDGVMVSAEARGRGVGTALLLAIKNKARDLGCAQVRLDVVDTNPRAKALYERQGFACQGASSIGPLRHLFGFRSATMMICNV